MMAAVTANKRTIAVVLLIELSIVFAAPFAIIQADSQAARFSALVVLVGYTGLRLLLGGQREYLRFNFSACREALTGILIRSLVGWCAIAVLVLYLYPNRFLCLVTHAPHIAIGIALAYSTFSVLLQEVAFRCYLAWRFDSLGLSFLVGAIVSAAIFGWVHIIYGSWLSVGLCFIAGLSFYRTYRKTESLAAVWLEHSLLGSAVFLLGLDLLFFSGGPSIEQFAPACAMIR